MAARILIAGDLAPIGAAQQAMSTGDGNWFTGGLEPYWGRADFRIANLECPLISRPTPPPKAGPAIGVTTSNADALSSFSLLGLANNHILDHGDEGLLNTINLLDAAGIPHVGAGENLESASQPHIATVNGLTVGFLAWSHHEFCIATDNSAGAFPIDLVRGLPILEELDRQCDFVILLYHGGQEHFPYPSPQQRQLCQFLAKRGADVILCQHSHIVGAKEMVGDSTIFYGQGNFCFDFDLPKNGAFPYWCHGILCELELFSSNAPIVNVIPTVQSLGDNLGPAIADSETAKDILARIDDYSAVLADQSRYQAQWEKLSEARAKEYLNRQIPVGRVGRKLLKLAGLSGVLNNQKRVLWNLNRLECEAHSDAICDGLKQVADQMGNSSSTT